MHRDGMYARAAVRAMVAEVRATPKPGLVDVRSNGAHRDMTLATFLESARAIGPYLTRIERVAAANAHLPGSELFGLLRPIGARAEQAMLHATGGINTHKGAIYTLGLLCAGASLCRARGMPLSARRIARAARSLAGDAVARDLAPLSDGAATSPRTAGERLFLRFGVRGIRGEAQRGFPSVLRIGLPALRRGGGRTAGEEGNAAAVNALLALIARVEDTNLLARGGQTGLLYAREESRRALALGGMSTPAGREAVSRMDDAFTARNLSPGGCADLLAASLYLQMLLEGA